jgi:hypothetical protein
LQLVLLSGCYSKTAKIQNIENCIIDELRSFAKIEHGFERIILISPLNPTIAEDY